MKDRVEADGWRVAAGMALLVSLLLKQGKASHPTNQTVDFHSFTVVSTTGTLRPPRTSTLQGRKSSFFLHNLSGITVVHVEAVVGSNGKREPHDA